MLKISIVIPHAGGGEMLTECLGSLAASRDTGFEVIIVENGSPEPPLNPAAFPDLEVQILHYDRPLGFAAACNAGVAAAGGDLVFLLNNDARVAPGSIALLAQKMAEDEFIAACQPKLLSARRDGWFDYSGAAGGEIDRYGYPFARGRVFDHIEEDRGQYDFGGDVFWGAGSALMLRRSFYLEAGGLEEPFFAHFEEIDLQWRLQLLGYRIVAVPEAQVWHLGAATIREGSFRKLYLNHRNSLAMLTRNYGGAALARNLPVRLLLDWVLAAYSLLRLDWRRFGAVLAAHAWLVGSIPYLVRGRSRVQALRRVRDNVLRKRIYNRSIVRLYFISGCRTWSELVKS